MTHDLADILFLAAQRAVRLDLTGVDDGFEQGLIQPDLSQVRFLQGDKLLAEFLQGKKLTFSGAFARF